MNVVAFWHIFAVNHWAEIAAEQLLCLKASGFPWPVDIGFIGGEREKVFLLDLADAHEVNVRVHRIADDLYEYPTLCLLKASAVSADACLYFHSKAVTHPGLLCYTAWRWAMNECCIAQWRSRLRDISAGNDAVGMALQQQAMTMPGQIFAGNFWWASGDWIRRRPDPVRPGSRFLCEDWLLCGGDSIPRAKTLVSENSQPHTDQYYPAHGNPHARLLRRLVRHSIGTQSCDDAHMHP